MNIEAMLDRFGRYFHSKFNTDISLQDPRYMEEEYTYKAERGRQMREWLGREALGDLIARGDWGEVCRRVTKSFAMTSGPLARWDEYQWVRHLDAGEQQQFVLALATFLHGEEDFGPRLERFVQEATSVYLHLRSRDPKQAEKFRLKKITWPFVTYFHFMMWPDQGFAFVKPDPLRKASTLAGFDIQYRAQVNVATYARVQEFYTGLWPTVKQLGGRDWIDVQTLIHVAGGGFGSSDSDWRAKLGEWLMANPRTMPPNVWQLRQDFVRRFPREGLANMTLEQYALGHAKSEDSFCYWLEYKTRPLGSVRGGSVDKWGVWWDKKAQEWRWNKFYEKAEDAEAVLATIVDGLLQLIDAVEAGRFDDLDRIGSSTLGAQRYSLRAKPLYMYFPEEFLPISNLEHAQHFLRVFGQEPQGGLHALNRQLLHLLRGLAEFQGFDTCQMMHFLYDAFPPQGGEPPVDGDGEPEERSLGDILAYVAASPYTFSPTIVTNYHLSLLTKPFVILTGLSGTGKTRLTRLYADAVHNVPATGANPYYALVAVRPDWTDSHALLGYYNPLTRTYEAPLFLRHMLKAAADRERAYFVCLDEMNLARVEYYFADFLSALESGEKVALHACDGQCVATRSGEGIPLLLAEDESDGPGYEKDGVLYVPAAVQIPDNLFISGTVNVDETTHAFSDKVLDRANSIEFDRVDLEEYAARFRGLGENYAALADEAMPLLGQIHQLLEPCYLHFGYRTLDEVLAYLWHNRQQTEALSPAEALDNQIMQKILPKLRGDERIREPMERLRVLLEKELGAESRSVRKLAWMLKELEAFGSTHFWR